MSQFYRIQVLRSAVGPPAFWCWTHWGRVGEDGQSKLLQSTDQDGAEREFRSKFTAKTGNKWGADPFVPKNKKYTLIEVEADEVDPKVAAALASVGAGAAARSAAAAAVEAEELETKLPLETLNLMQLMFDDVRWRVRGEPGWARRGMRHVGLLFAMTPGCFPWAAGARRWLLTAVLWFLLPLLLCLFSCLCALMPPALISSLARAGHDAGRHASARH